MYYIIYPILYLLSLLPFFILYRLSDLLYFLIYYIFGYRKKIVLDNISIAFPEKNLSEKTRIAKTFYKNFVDTFIETIKMISMSEEQFDKRVTADTKACNELAAKGKSIQFHSGHQMNWEYANWIFVKNLDLPFVGIYQPISNKVFNKIFYTLRARFGTILVSTREFRSKMQQLLKTQYSIALAADQNGNPDSSYWLYFFSKPAPFVTGPDKGALRNNTAVVFVSFDKIKRGHYHFHTEVVIENANELKPGELTIKYRDFLEATIRKYPDNYLWSHRRWKNTYKSAYQNNWIDTRVKPG